MFWGKCRGSLELLFLNDSRREKLVERDEVQLRERRVVEYAEVAVLRHQIVGTGSEGAITTGFIVAYLL